MSHGDYNGHVNHDDNIVNVFDYIMSTLLLAPPHHQRIAGTASTVLLRSFPRCRRKGVAMLVLLFLPLGHLLWLEDMVDPAIEPLILF